MGDKEAQRRFTSYPHCAPPATLGESSTLFQLLSPPPPPLLIVLLLKGGVAQLTKLSPFSTHYPPHHHTHIHTPRVCFTRVCFCVLPASIQRMSFQLGGTLAMTGTQGLLCAFAHCSAVKTHTHTQKHAVILCSFKHLKKNRMNFSNVKVCVGSGETET